MSQAFRFCARTFPEAAQIVWKTSENFAVYRIGDCLKRIDSGKHCSRPTKALPWVRAKCAFPPGGRPSGGRVAVAWKLTKAQRMGPAWKLVRERSHFCC